MALDAITPADARARFAHVGYVLDNGNAGRSSASGILLRAESETLHRPLRIVRDTERVSGARDSAGGAGW